MRSIHLLDRKQCGLLVVDLQEKLLPVIPNAERIVWNTSRLIRGAAAFSLPRTATAQYPRGLGPLTSVIAEAFPAPEEKTRFSAVSDSIDQWCRKQELSQVVVCGIETHICILQTVMDLMALGYDVHVPVDSVGARNELDHTTALRRMESCGATTTTVEAILFEWCDCASHPMFKLISSLVTQNSSPENSRLGDKDPHGQVDNANPN